MRAALRVQADLAAATKDSEGGIQKTGLLLRNLKIRLLYWGNPIIYYIDP